MTPEVEAAISAVYLALPEHPQHLVSRGAWQHHPVFLDPTEALVNIMCLPTHAHMQMLIARAEQRHPGPCRSNKDQSFTGQ